LASRGFSQLRRWTHGVDTDLFAFAQHPQDHELLAGLTRPIALYVGRVSYEKNISAFIEMPWHGSKVVCGVGPLEAKLKAQCEQVRWLGVLPRDTLAKVYASADVFTFSSLHETFGLVMLEAMACGTPVAAYPVDGPSEVLSDPLHPESAQDYGGVLDNDLSRASLAALQVARRDARSHAEKYSWKRSTILFLSHLRDCHDSVINTP
jgi:glycosyltransferase involved in cell wall biosynthesis